MNRTAPATRLVTKFAEMGTMLHASGADLAGYRAFARQWQGRGHDLAMANGNAWMVDDIHRILSEGAIEYEEAGARKVAQVDIGRTELSLRVDRLNYEYADEAFTNEVLSPDLRLAATGSDGRRILVVVEHKWTGSAITYGTREEKQPQKYVAYRDQLAASPGVDLVVTQYRVYGLVDDAFRLDFDPLIEKGFQLFMLGGP